MKCPFCSESIHPTAKFCPKCGLPLKDDTTVMGGAYVADGGRQSHAMLIGGAALLVLISLFIGWLSGRASQETATVPQPTPRVAATNSSIAFNPAGLPLNGGAQFASANGYAPPTPPSVNWNPSVRWAWTPSGPPPVYVPQPEPMAPPTMGQLHGLITQVRRERRPGVTRTTVVPDAPPLPENLVAMEEAALAEPPRRLGGGVEVTDTPDGPFYRQAPLEDGNGRYVFDPTRGEYVLNADRPAPRPTRRPSGGQPQTPVTAPARSGTGG